MLFFYEKIREKVYNKINGTRHLPRIKPITRFQIKRENKNKNIKIMKNIKNMVSQDIILPPIKKRFYKPDIGRNALIQLCGYPKSLKNIDEMIADRQFEFQ